MAKRFIIFNGILILLFSSTFGQKDTSDKKTFFAIKTDLAFLSAYALPAIYNRAYISTLTFEKGFSYRHSFQVSAGYIGPSQTNIQMWRLIPEYKIFLKKERNFSGFYVGVYLKYLNQVRLIDYGNKDNKHIVENILSYGAGATFGYQFYIKKHLTFDFLFGLGGQYTVTHYDVPPDAILIIAKPTHTFPPLPPKGLDGRVSVNFGYKF